MLTGSAPSATSVKSENRLDACNPVDVMLTGIAGAMSSTASTAPAIRSAETTKASTKPAPKRAFTQLTLSSLPMWNKKPTSVKRTKTTQQKDVKKVPADVQVKTDIMIALHWIPPSTRKFCVQDPARAGRCHAS
ncbi:hypothetical protein DYB36_010105 [Aphanomyces astaci]|uniref:Uncharacterized protein n=1 Tax=Aphanomyces astaci TaxID=112090 RepID=A0A397BFM7_APHAT|nr:hypothetical protein DYB36_010105 [Aphanomyces astaci]